MAEYKLPKSVWLQQQKQRMKLLAIFPSTLRGGVEEYTLKIASAARQEGWDAHVAFPQTNGTASLIEDFTAQGICYHPLAIAEQKNGRQLESVVDYLPQLIKTLTLLIKVKPDVVQIILPWPTHCLGCILACGILHIPTVVRFGLVASKFSLSDKRKKIYAWARARNQQWVALSQNNRQLICDVFGIPEPEVLQIYNGVTVKEAEVNCDSEATSSLRTQIRQELGLSTNHQIALTVGRLTRQKGYADLIPVIPEVLKQFPQVRFVWVGEGQQRDYLSDRVKKYGVEDQVLFLGYRSDVPKLLQAADLFVFPTLYEGHSSALTEAMAYGLPIVTSDASGIPEVIEHQVHGLIFPTGDRAQLKAAICWALTHPEQMQTMARNARDRAQDFSEEKMIQQYLEVWRKLSLPNSIN